MLAKCIDKIVSLAKNETYEINGDTYSDHSLYRVPPHVDRPCELSVGSLDGIVKLIKTEMDVLTPPLLVRIANYRTVEVFSSFDEYMQRDSLYEATSCGPDFREGWRQQAEAIIELKSRFVQTEDSEYLLNLISHIVSDDSVSSDDNGVSQKVTTRSGIALVQNTNVRSRVTLKPFRTFPEVAQPASEFVLRLGENGEIGLFEGDGKVWTLEAKKNIAGYFEAALADEIAAGKVVVMM